MPLTAIDDRTGERVVICEAYEHAREVAREGHLICPYCDMPVVAVNEHIRQGDWVTAHSRHKASQPCTSTYRYHPETSHHLAAKYFIGKTAASEFGYGDTAVCAYEVRMLEINRIADVCFMFLDGTCAVHEAQLAAISTQELEERTSDYQSLGYTIFWHFGKSANTESNRYWAFQRLGGCAVLDFYESVEAII